MRDAELLCFSSISIWEIARLVKAGDLEIPVTPARLADMLMDVFTFTGDGWQRGRSLSKVDGEEDVRATKKGKGK